MAAGDGLGHLFVLPITAGAAFPVAAHRSKVRCRTGNPDTLLFRSFSQTLQRYAKSADLQGLRKCWSLAPMRIVKPVRQPYTPRSATQAVTSVFIRDTVILAVYSNATPLWISNGGGAPQTQPDGAEALTRRARSRRRPGLPEHAGARPLPYFD